MTKTQMFAQRNCPSHQPWSHYMTSIFEKENHFFKTEEILLQIQSLCIIIVTHENLNYTYPTSLQNKRS